MIGKSAIIMIFIKFLHQNGYYNILADVKNRCARVGNKPDNNNNNNKKR